VGGGGRERVCLYWRKAKSNLTNLEPSTPDVPEDCASEFTDKRTQEINENHLTKFSQRNRTWFV
jgi:hypothetical protein